MLLNVSSDEKVMPTTYGELRPPLGKYRLKVGIQCEFIVIPFPIMIGIFFGSETKRLDEK